MLYPKLANQNVNQHDNLVPASFTFEHSSEITAHSATKENDKQNRGVTKATKVDRENALNKDKEEKYLNTNSHTPIRASSLDIDITINKTRISVPKKTKNTRRQLRKAQEFFQKNHQEKDFEDEKSDACMNFGHSDDIFENLRSMEILLKPDPSYMDKQTEITWKHRSTLIDWIMGVHQRFNFSPETLFLSVNLLDRFLASTSIQLEKLQLAGITALLIASKYEENKNSNKITLKKFLYMIEDAYSHKEFISAEKYMLKKLEYNLGWPGPLSFLRRINKADDYDIEIRNMAKYFLEVATLDEQFVDCIPSFLSAGAYYLARDILKKRDWVCL